MAVGCDSGSVGRTRDEFKDLYSRRDYSKASRTLTKILNGCTKTMWWLDLGSIRNDLAITQYHLHRPKDCLKTLEPLAADASLSDEDIRKNFAPTDADNYLPIVRATRTNLELCRKSSEKH